MLKNAQHVLVEAGKSQTSNLEIGRREYSDKSEHLQPHIMYALTHMMLERTLTEAPPEMIGVRVGD